VTNDRFPGAPSAGVLTGNSFVASVPLALGNNVLTVLAQDLSGNASTAVTYQVVLLQQLQISDIAPANGAAIITESTTISGKVHASSAIGDVNVYINEFSAP